MKHLKTYEKYKTKYPILFKVGDYVIYKWDGKIKKITKIRNRVGKKSTTYFWKSLTDNTGGLSHENDKEIRLATPKEIENYKIKKDSEKYNL